MAEKLLNKIDRREDGCWMFLGAWDGGLYGQISQGKDIRKRAHVVSYEHHVGPIPTGMCVCHKCDNPWCVNPEHLFLGTKADNYHDMANKGRAFIPRGELSGVARLKEKEVIIIYQLLLKGHTQQEIADAFEVSRSCIRDIKLGRHWNHLYREYMQ